jgi:prefoldin subunit 5
MAETVTLEFLGMQLERIFAELSGIRAEQTSIREDLRVLTAIVMRHGASLSAIIEQLRGMTAQFQRFDARLRRLEEQATP